MGRDATANPDLQAARERAAILMLAVPDDRLAVARFEISNQIGREYPALPRYQRQEIARRAARQEYERRYPR